MPVTWPPAQSLSTRFLDLEPIRASHAVEMVAVLADPALYEFIGGGAPTLEQLERRYAAQAVGCSPDGGEWWLNWVIRERESGRTVGYVQATVERADRTRSARVAWVVAPLFQGRGYASAATAAMIDWLHRAGVDTFSASIHPDHHASAAVAERQGFVRSGVRDDEGEDVWQLSAGTV